MTICELIKKKNYYRLMQEEYIQQILFEIFFNVEHNIPNTTQKNIPNTEFCEILSRGIYFAAAFGSLVVGVLRSHFMGYLRLRT